MALQFRLPMFGVVDSHAKTSRLQELAKDMDLTDQNQNSFMNSLNSLITHAQLLSSSKTFQVSYLLTEDETSKSLYDRWPKAGMLLDGVCLTANISESPNHVVESTLLDILEDQDIPQKYYLSRNAATGGLRRAKSQGRSLFPPLKKAFETLVRERSSKK